MPTFGHKLKSTYVATGGDWEPDDLASCLAWFDASRPGDFTLDGSYVDSWASRVGVVTADNTSDSDATRGAYTSGEYVNFNNGSKYLRFSDGLLVMPGTTGASVFIVAATTTATSTQQLLSSNTVNVQIRLDNERLGYASASSHLGSGKTTTNKITVNEDFIACLITPSDDYTYCILDGDESGAATGSTQNPSSQTYNQLAVRSSTGERLNGYMREIICYDIDLSTSDRQKVEGYLAHKWSITGVLPATHPYKSSAP